MTSNALGGLGAAAAASICCMICIGERRADVIAVAFDLKLKSNQAKFLTSYDLKSIRDRTLDVFMK